MFITNLLAPTHKKRVIFFLFFDIFISITTIFIAYMLRFNFSIPVDFFSSMLTMMLLLIPLKIAVFSFFKIYFVAWRYFGLAEYRKLIFAHLLTYPFFTLLFLILYSSFCGFPRSIIFIDLFLSLFFIGFLRISRRIYLESYSKSTYMPTLLFGVNEKAVEVIKSATRGEISYQPIALISNKTNLVGTYFSGLKVHSEDEIKKVIREYEIYSVIITESLDQKKLDMLFKLLNELGIKEIKITQMFQDDKPALKDISIEDLLARKPKDLDRISIVNFIVGKVVLITGAGGSIGSELSRQVIAFGAKQVILLDHSEFNLYQITEELQGEAIVSVLQSVKDAEKLENIFATYLPDVVLHAAAYKHVPLCEENIDSAIQNNIFGTKNVIDLSVEYGVEKFVLISTDKAVRPTNVMGTTKRVCELYAHAVPHATTDIVAVRFGNVLGSSGSVIPKFKSQIEKGQNITVTHPEITRYFMLIPEACQLVLQAASIAKGGELFILDMGEPIKIAELAQKMIELSKRDDIKIEYIGLRAGEKLYEELLIDASDLKTEYDSIMVSKTKPVDYDILLSKINKLQKGDLLAGLKEIVPEFEHKV